MHVTCAVFLHRVDSRLTVEVHIDHLGIPLMGICDDCGVNAIMQLIPFNNSDIPHSHDKNITYIQDTNKFTVSTDREGALQFFPYYLCCERRLTPSILYITVVYM